MPYYLNGDVLLNHSVVRCQYGAMLTGVNNDIHSVFNQSCCWCFYSVPIGESINDSV